MTHRLRLSLAHGLFYENEDRAAPSADRVLLGMGHVFDGLRDSVHSKRDNRVLAGNAVLARRGGCGPCLPSESTHRRPKRWYPNTEE
jgi:hypothetical protein